MVDDFQYNYKCPINLTETDISGGFIIKPHQTVNGDVCRPNIVFSKDGFADFLMFDPCNCLNNCGTSLIQFDFEKKDPDPLKLRQVEAEAERLRQEQEAERLRQEQESERLRQEQETKRLRQEQVAKQQVLYPRTTVIPQSIMRQRADVAQRSVRQSPSAAVAQRSVRQSPSAAVARQPVRPSAAAAQTSPEKQVALKEGIPTEAELKLQLKTPNFPLELMLTTDIIQLDVSCRAKHPQILNAILNNCLKRLKSETPMLQVVKELKISDLNGAKSFARAINGIKQPGKTPITVTEQETIGKLTDDIVDKEGERAVPMILLGHTIVDRQIPLGDLRPIMENAVLYIKLKEATESNPAEIINLGELLKISKKLYNLGREAAEKHGAKYRGFS